MKIQLPPAIATRMRRIHGMNAAGRRIAGGMMLVGWLCVAATAQTRDVADWMPPDSMFYVGWNGGAGGSKPVTRLLTQWLSGLAGVSGNDARLRATEKAVAAATLAVESPGGLAIRKLAIRDGALEFSACLVVSSEGKSAELCELVNAAMEALTPGRIDHPMGSDGRGFSTLIGESPLTFYWTDQQGKFFAGIESNRSTDRFKWTEPPPPESLGGAERFRSGTDVARSGDIQPTIRAFCDLERLILLVESLASSVGPLPWKDDDERTAWGLDSFHTWHWNIETGARGTTVRSWLNIAPQTGLLSSLFRQDPITDDDLRAIPRDAYWAQTWNLNLDTLWFEINTLVSVIAAASDKETVDPVSGTVGIGGTDTEQIARFLALVESFGLALGVSLTDDLLPSLGDTWTLYDAPENGGLLLSGTILTIEARNRDKLAGIVGRLAEKLPLLVKQLAPDVQPRLKTAQFGTLSVQYLALGGVAAPIAPAWGFSANRLVIGLSPQSVAAALRHLDRATPRPSLLDNEDFKTGRTKFGGEPMSIGYLDTRAAARWLYPIAHLYATTISNMASLSGVDIDFAAFPLAADALADARPIVSAGIRRDDGVLYVQTGSGPSLISVAAAGAFSSLVLLPIIEVAQQQAKRAGASKNLEQIAMGIRAYREDAAGRWPPSFDVLIDQGLLTPASLRSPRDPVAERAFVYIGGSNAVESEPGRVIVAYEKPIDGDGTNVLFADLRVRWIAGDEFRRMLAETRKIK